MVTEKKRLSRIERFAEIVAEIAHKSGRERNDIQVHDAATLHIGYENYSSRMVDGLEYDSGKLLELRKAASDALNAILPPESYERTKR
jgi:outer membrane translocation and assembly module TamA